MNFVGLMREARLQEKLLHQNLKKHAHRERDSNQDLLTWSKSCWSHKLVETLTWLSALRLSMGQGENDTLWGYSPWGALLLSYAHQEYLRKIPSWLWEGKRKSSHSEICPGLSAQQRTTLQGKPCLNTILKHYPRLCQLLCPS